MQKILWTGGWDSTYRLLDLTLNQRKMVQPYYVVDVDRPSMDVEISTMESIKKMIAQKNVASRALILETIMIELTEIPENSALSQKYLDLRAESHLGSQYDWLARYADALGIDELELCIHQEDKAEKFIRKDVHYDEVKKTFKMNEILTDPSLEIFSYYSFPVLNFSKLDMEQQAKRDGFYDVMERTWFCYMPTPKGAPCGWCNPCRYTREEGLGRRVPSKITGFFNGAERKIRRVLERK